MTEDEQAAIAGARDPEVDKLWDALTEQLIAAGSAAAKLTKRVSELERQMLMREATLRRQLLVLLLITSATTIVLTKFIGG